VRTSGRVESENKVNKLFGNSKTTLFDLVNKLNEHTEQQAELEKLAAREVQSVLSVPSNSIAHDLSVISHSTSI
jgi:hypothetical protein